MTFKFTLLGIETRCCEDSDNTKEQKVEVKMRKKSNSKKSKKHRQNFTKAVQHCHAKTKGRKSFGKCMKRRLKK